MAPLLKNPYGFSAIKRIFYAVCDNRWNMDSSLHFSWLAGKVLASVFWDAHNILFIHYLEKEKTIISEYYMALFARLKENIAKNDPKWRRKKCSFTKTMQHRNNGKIARIALSIAYLSTVYSGSVSQRLLPVCRPIKNAPGKDIWLQWRSDCRNWSVFWSLG